MEFEVTKEKIEKIFTLQQKNKFLVGRTNYKERIKKLNSISSWIENHSKEIHEVLHKDLRKSPPETDLSEIFVVQSEIKHAVKHLKSWMKPRKAAKSLTFLNTASAIHFVPRGVVLIIAPWNFPFMLTLGPLISAIAAGNSVFVKPSELSPHTSGLINKMISELFPSHEISVFEGDLNVSVELLKKPFDHIFFTGSPAVGKKIMEAASHNLSSITLELGGKSPAIVDATADIKLAGRKLAWGKLLNAGQTCIAPDYVLADSQIHDELISEIIQNIKKLYGKSEEDRKKTPDLPRIINERHFERLKLLLK